MYDHIWAYHVICLKYKSISVLKIEFSNCTHSELSNEPTLDSIEQCLMYDHIWAYHVIFLKNKSISVLKIAFSYCIHSELSNEPSTEMRLSERFQMTSRAHSETLARVTWHDVMVTSWDLERCWHVRLITWGVRLIMLACSVDHVGCTCAGSQSEG